MNPVQKALWFVENHSCMSINLEQIAKASNVSPYHLTRAFADVLGISLMRYVRQRRLSEAAKELVSGTRDILSIALDHGYNSHEAFSRAFKEEFKVTPESVRQQRLIDHLILTEPIVMRSTLKSKLQKPRIEILQPKKFVGIIELYDCKSPAGIPNQWQKFSLFLGNIPKQIGKDAYGVCFNFNDEGYFNYLSGVEVKDYTEIPLGLVQFSLPKQKYAVFSHAGHIAEIRGVIAAIWQQALETSGYEATEGAMLERYGEEFDPRTGLGGFEIWVAVK
jgi:AraC family transcriptional regulator